LKPVYIAVLGSGSQCSKENQINAFQIGQELAKSGAVTLSGGLSGIFAYAFEGAKEQGGQTIAILGEATEPPVPSKNCDHILTTGIGLAKHSIIANVCDGAIVIEGWLGTLALISEFLTLKKHVVLLENSGGIASTLINRPLIDGSDILLEHYNSAEKCVQGVMNKINMENK